MGKIFFIMWISGAWKGTLIANLKNLHDDRVYFPLSYKSRQIRETEINWVDAWFVSREDFEQSIKNHDFLEYAKVYGLDDYYGTKYSDVIDNWLNKWKIVIKEVDMEGLLIIKKERLEIEWKYKSIFLFVSPEIQLERIKARWAYMSETELEERRKTAVKEIEEAKNNCDYVIDTWWKSREEVLEDVLKIINI